MKNIHYTVIIIWIDFYPMNLLIGRICMCGKVLELSLKKKIFEVWAFDCWLLLRGTWMLYQLFTNAIKSKVFFKFLDHISNEFNTKLNFEIQYIWLLCYWHCLYNFKYRLYYLDVYSILRFKWKSHSHLPAGILFNASFPS